MEFALVGTIWGFIGCMMLSLFIDIKTKNERREKQSVKEILIVKSGGKKIKYVGNEVQITKNKIQLDSKVFSMHDDISWYTYYPEASLIMKHKIYKYFK